MKIGKVVVLTTILFLTGCNNSDLEKKNIELEKELNTIRKNNKDLSVTLAKSELKFSKKHKEEFKKEEERLAKERINIEKNAKNKYMIIIFSIVIFFLAFIVFSFFTRTKYNKKISDKDTNINKLNNFIAELNQRGEERTKLINNLEFKIKETEMRAKENSINQVVRKIDENQEYRSNLLKRIEKDLTHA